MKPRLNSRPGGKRRSLICASFRSRDKATSTGPPIEPRTGRWEVPVHMPSNAAQIEDWKAAVGRTWTQFQEQLERQLDPLGREALRALAPMPGEHILDIGCGCGATTLDLAVRVGPVGSVVGVDISVPMLDVARRRPRPADAGAAEYTQRAAQYDPLGAGFRP